MNNIFYCSEDSGAIRYFEILFKDCKNFKTYHFNSIENLEKLIGLINPKDNILNNDWQLYRT